MNNMKTVGVGLCMAVVALVSGCASFPGNHLPQVGTLQRPHATVQKMNATYSFTAEADIFGKQTMGESARAILKSEFTDTLRDSGCFSLLSEGAQAGVMHMDVRFEDSGNPAALIPAVITGLSLYTIPSWATDHFNITVNVQMPDGRKRSYKLYDSMTTVQWLPMIFVAPFKNMINVSKDVRCNIWKNLVVEMQKDGLLPAAGTVR